MKTHSKEKIQLVNELHKPMRKNYARRRTIIKGLDDLWQMDLADISQYAHYNQHFKIIMVVIDCFSKFSVDSPLEIKDWRRDNDRLRRYISSQQSVNGTYRGIDVLPEITKTYNETRHRTTGYKPSQVNKSKEKGILKSWVTSCASAKINISSIRDIGWSTELFKITSNPIRGAFYTEKLHKTASPDIYLVEKVLRRKGRKVFVKWLGFDNIHNSWIDNTNVIWSELLRRSRSTCFASHRLQFIFGICPMPVWIVATLVILITSI
ncbi:hypothetical protein NQ318_021623 [Aromia moschata]|uniref:Chromo domain-containing protein n=1 Tax=Aromia moschata TaxID=1265417 RepID=A0AAV8X9U7_9CUCU|nr:hypothetical protein NQ318_021623 [Aromia moschata]